MIVNKNVLQEQLTALHAYVENVLGESCSVCVYHDGGIFIETPVTDTKAGRGFAFDSLEEMARDLPGCRK